MSAAFDNQNPIGLAAIIKSVNLDINIGVYVREDYRYKGIGSNLVRLMKGRHTGKIIPWIELGRDKFWSKALV